MFILALYVLFLCFVFVTAVQALRIAYCRQFCKSECERIAIGAIGISLLMLMISDFSSIEQISAGEETMFAIGGVLGIFNLLMLSTGEKDMAV